MYLKVNAILNEWYGESGRSTLCALLLRVQYECSDGSSKSDVYPPGTFCGTVGSTVVGRLCLEEGEGAWNPGFQSAEGGCVLCGSDAWNPGFQSAEGGRVLCGLSAWNLGFQVV